MTSRQVQPDTYANVQAVVKMGLDDLTYTDALDIIEEYLLSRQCRRPDRLEEVSNNLGRTAWEAGRRNPPSVFR